MKHRIFKLSALASTMFLASLMSCEKQDDTDTVQNDDAEPEQVVLDFVKDREADKQDFSVSATSSQTIVGTEGTQITVPANAFVDMDGNPVTGPVDVSLIEVYKKSDMVINAKPTISDGKVLVSGGEFSISATAGGNVVRIADGKTLSVSVPATTNDPDMGIFIGSTDDSGNFDWDEYFGCTMDSSFQNSGYFLNIDTLSWINVDKFYNSTNTDMTINLPNGFSTEKALTYVVFNDINSVIQAYDSDGGESYDLARMPLGESITIFSMAGKDDKLYATTTTLTVTSNVTVDLTYTELTQSEIDVLLESLDN